MTVPQSTAAVAPAKRRGGFVGDFFTGASFTVRGFGMYARTPRVMVLGLLPAVISFALLIVGLLALFYWVDELTVTITPFLSSWPDGLRDTARILIEVAIVGFSLLGSLLLFTALTLTVGQPFYEAISKHVEDRLGGVPGEINVSFWKTLPRSIFESIRLILVTMSIGVFVFLVELIPVAGQIAAPILAATLGGWALAVELTSVPFERRGLRLRDRRRALRKRRSMSLGFGISVFLCFLIPGGAVLAMPAAVAGSTLLTRRLFGQPD